MADRQILAIVGATGAQGGGLARAALEDSERRFEVRALTRNADSDKARALAAQGAIESAEVDLDARMQWNCLGDFKAQIPRHRPPITGEK